MTLDDASVDKSSGVYCTKFSGAGVGTTRTPLHWTLPSKCHKLKTGICEMELDFTAGSGAHAWTLNSSMPCQFKRTTVLRQVWVHLLVSGRHHFSWKNGPTMQLTNTWTALKTDKNETTNISDQKMGQSSITWPDDVAVHIHYTWNSPQWAVAAECSWKWDYLNTKYWNLRFHVTNTIIRTTFSEYMTSMSYTDLIATRIKHETHRSVQSDSNAINTEVIVEHK
jgi:hypothetical protein